MLSIDKIIFAAILATISLTVVAKKNVDYFTVLREGFPSKQLKPALEHVQNQSDPNHLQSIYPYLSHSQQKVRIAALNAIVRINSPKALTALAEALQKTNQASESL